MGSKEQLAADATVSALKTAHEATKGKIVFVISEFGSDNSEALIDFFEVDPKSKDVKVHRRVHQTLCCLYLGNQTHACSA